MLGTNRALSSFDMADTQKFDARLEEGIAYFEQMLKLMPEDRTTLEFLVVAYDQLGQKEKGEKCLVSLVKLLLKQDEFAAAAALLPRLEAAESSEAKVLALRVKRLSAPAPELVPEAPKELTESEIVSEMSKEAIKAELSLVEALSTGGILKASDAENLRKQLSASPVDGRIFLISALSILEKENFELFEKCLAFLADQFAMAPIPLASFEPQADLAAKFSAPTVRIRGAVPFARLGEFTLVAVLNPMDEKLRGAFAAEKTRFYLASPSSVEHHLEKLYGEVKG